MTALTTAALLLAGLTPDGEASRLRPRARPYAELVRASSHVVLARIEAAEAVELRSEPGPLPEGETVTDARGRTSTAPVPLASWRREELRGPPRLWSWRASVEIVEAFRGESESGNLLTADLAFAVSRSFLEQFLGSPNGGPLASTGSLLVLHLRAGEGAEAPLGLAARPWPVAPGEEDRVRADMGLRMRRLGAQAEIDDLVGRFDELSPPELARLRRLATAPPEELGAELLSDGERAYRQRVLAASGPGEAATWRAWWAERRNGYVNEPFRVFVGRGAGR